MLTRYAEFAPTQFDSPGLNADSMGHDDGDRSAWYVAPCSVTRDSGPAERANWTSIQAILNEKGLEFEVHRFGHWGPGWFEIAIVRPTPEAEAELERIQGALWDYPILDDTEIAQEEAEDDNSDWRNWLCREVERAIEAEARPDETDDADTIIAAILPCRVRGFMAYSLRDLYDAACGHLGKDRRYEEQRQTERDRAIATVVASVWARYRSRPTDPRAFVRWRGAK